MKLDFPDSFSKKSNIKFHENPSSGSRAVVCGQTDGRRDITKPSVAFRNIANALKTDTNMQCQHTACFMELFFKLKHAYHCRCYKHCSLVRGFKWKSKYKLEYRFSKTSNT